MVITTSLICSTCEGCVYKGQDESATQQQIFWDANACDRQQDESDQCHPSKVQHICFFFYIISLQMYLSTRWSGFIGLNCFQRVKWVMLQYIWYVNLYFITARTMSLASWTYLNLSLPHLRDEQAFLESESGSESVEISKCYCKLWFCNLWLCIVILDHVI